MDPITRMVYWNKDLKNLWEPRISRIKKAYRNTELSTMIAGMRRVYVYHIRSDSFDNSYDFLRKNGLVFYPTNRSGIYQGFSNRHLPVKQGEPYMLYGAAVRADDLEAGELFTEYSKPPVNHQGIADLLGYPECCSKFFTDVWEGDCVDPMYEAACNTPDVDIIKSLKEEIATVHCHPYCNNMLRYFGIRIVPHLTCSLQCEESISWANEWMEIMYQIDPQAADWTVELLSSPMTWDCLKGIAIIDTPIFRGVSNSNNYKLKKKVISLGV